MVQETLSASGWSAGRLQIASPPGYETQAFGPYRPYQWSQTPQVYSVTINEPDFTSGAAGVTQHTYFFDAMLRAEHTQELVLTKHPVQSGAPIVDHAYLMPALLTLEIGMSDAMESYDPNAYNTGSTSKSVNAFNKFLSMQASRAPMTVATRLRQYDNMLLRIVRAQEDNRTRGSLRATLIFEEIIMGGVAGTGAATPPVVSQREWTTDETQLGTTAPGSPSQSTIDNFGDPPVFLKNVPGAGSMTSNFQQYLVGN